MLRPKKATADPSADAAAMLRRLGFALLFFGFPVSALFARRADRDRRARGGGSHPARGHARRGRARPGRQAFGSLVVARRPCGRNPVLLGDSLAPLDSFRGGSVRKASEHPRHGGDGDGGISGGAGPDALGQPLHPSRRRRHGGSHGHDRAVPRRSHGGSAEPRSRHDPARAPALARPYVAAFPGPQSGGAASCGDRGARRALRRRFAGAASAVDRRLRVRADGRDAGRRLAADRRRHGGIAASGAAASVRSGTPGGGDSRAQIQRGCEPFRLARRHPVRTSAPDHRPRAGDGLARAASSAFFRQTPHGPFCSRSGTSSVSSARWRARPCCIPR